MSSLITSSELAQTENLRTTHKQTPPKVSSEHITKSPRDALTRRVRPTTGRTRNNQQQPTSSEGPPASDARTLRAHTRSNRDVISQQPPIPPYYHPSPTKEEAEEGDYEGDESSPHDEGSDADCPHNEGSDADSHHSSHHSNNRDFYREQPTLESLQQFHDSELQSVTQKHELELQNRDALLAKYQATEQRLRARAKQQQHDTDNNYQAPYYNKQQPECRDRGHRGQLNSTTRRDQGHTPNPPWKPTPHDVSPTRSHTSHVRSHNPHTLGVSPTRSQLSWPHGPPWMGGTPIPAPLPVLSILRLT